MRSTKDNFHRTKLSLSNILRNEGLDLMSKDKDVIDRIFNLLTEEKNVHKIEGILSSTEIIKYGGDMNEDRASKLYEKILEWWQSEKPNLFY